MLRSSSGLRSGGSPVSILSGTSLVVLGRYERNCFICSKASSSESATLSTCPLSWVCILYPPSSSLLRVSPIAL